MASEVHIKRNPDGKSSSMEFRPIKPEDVTAQVELSTSEPISANVPKPKVDKKK